MPVTRKAGSMSELTFRSASELARLIRERHVSAVEVLEAHLAQIERHNPALNAIVTLDADGARRRALEADGELRRGGPVGPLHGVPITLKDCHATAGMRTTSGYAPLADYVPEADSTIAARLRAGGAVILGKTNVSELLAHFQTDNDLFGRTNNPWDIDRTAGGSSGGAAAAIAAGLIPLDIGSDIGGSIRIPAHCCGIVGLKPTERRVSNHGHIPDLPQHPRSTRVMNCCGPMARHIDDLELAMRLIAGADGRDTEVPPVPFGDVPHVDPRDLRLSWTATVPGWPVSGEIAAAVERLAGGLARHAARVEEVALPLDLDTQVALRQRLRGFVRVFRDPLPDTGPPSAADYFQTLHERDAAIIAWERFFERWDAYLYPIAATTAFPHCPRDMPIPVDDGEIPYPQWAAACLPCNLTGHPAVAIPIGLDQRGLPIGVQIVGPRWSDERLLGIARAVAEVVGPFPHPPDRWTAD
jgi:amidase